MRELARLLPKDVWLIDFEANVDRLVRRERRGRRHRPTPPPARR